MAKLADAVRIGSLPSVKNWATLNDLNKNSKREHAADYAYLLRTVRCDFEKGESGREPSLDGFSTEEIEHLARMEHDRWVEERRNKQSGHLEFACGRNCPRRGKLEKERHPLGRGDPEIVSSKEAAGSCEVVHGVHGWLAVTGLKATSETERERARGLVLRI
jgi:hypothetical protein